VDGWAVVVAVLALVVSAAALLIAWWQLLLQRDAAGGRGIIFEVHRPIHKEARVGGELIVTDRYFVIVKLVGNDLHEVAVHLERDGRQLEFGDPGYVDETPETLHRFTCEDEPLTWEFELGPDDARDLWCVLSWVAPYGPAVRTNALRRPLEPPHELERWRWFRSFRAIRWVEAWGVRRPWRWLRCMLSRPHRVGEWRRVRGRDCRPGQSPIRSRAEGTVDEVAANQRAETEVRGVRQSGASPRNSTVRIDFISGFERRLNDGLWVVAIVSGIYAFVQHVMLKDSPEIFPHGAELGDLVYDMAIAYVGAFVFYVLVVQLPLQRDRTNMYSYLAPIFHRVSGVAVALMRDLNKAAGLDENRDNTRPNVEATCKSLTPQSRVEMFFPQDDNAKPGQGVWAPGTVMQTIGYHIGRAREVNAEIMTFATYLDSAVVRSIAEIESCGLFKFYDMTGGHMDNEDLSVFSGVIFDYLRLVDRLGKYCREIGLDIPSASSLPRDDYAIPLAREMKSL
jgi:hypothetical protein